MQLVIDEELLTFDSEEQTPNSIDSLKYLLHTSSALDSFQPLIQSLACRKDSTNSIKHYCTSSNNYNVHVEMYKRSVSYLICTFQIVVLSLNW
jgi:hypothetical protein